MEGKLEGQADMLLRIFKARYGDIPSWVRGKVVKADPDMLNEWSVRLFRAKRIENIFCDYCEGAISLLKMPGFVPQPSLLVTV